jgi:hypothetical protein
MAEQRELSGTLSRKKKREHDRQPEFKGSATIDGVAYWLSAWVKEGDDGKFFSLSFTRKEQQPKTEARPASGSPELQAKYGSNGRRDDHRRGVENDEIPF